VGPVVDYVTARRRGELGLPARPDYTLAGRTADAVEREAAAWHAALGRRDAQIRLQPVADRWQPSGLAGFDRTDVETAVPGAAAVPRRRPGPRHPQPPGHVRRAGGPRRVGRGGGADRARRGGAVT